MTTIDVTEKHLMRSAQQRRCKHAITLSKMNKDLISIRSILKHHSRRVKMNVFNIFEKNRTA